MATKALPYAGRTILPASHIQTDATMVSGTAHGLPAAMSMAAIHNNAAAQATDAVRQAPAAPSRAAAIARGFARVKRGLSTCIISFAFRCVEHLVSALLWFSIL